MQQCNLAWENQVSTFFWMLQERQISVTAEMIEKMNIIYFIIVQVKKGIFFLNRIKMIILNSIKSK